MDPVLLGNLVYLARKHGPDERFSQSLWESGEVGDSNRPVLTAAMRKELHELEERIHFLEKCESTGCVWPFSTQAVQQSVQQIRHLLKEWNPSSGENECTIKLEI